MICTLGVCSNVTVADAVAVTAPPATGVPVTVAVLTMSSPASIAAWPTGNDAVHSIESSGANDAGCTGPQVNSSNKSSTTLTSVNVTLPALRAVNVYTTSPGAVTLSGNATFVNVTCAAGATVGTTWRNSAVTPSGSLTVAML